MQNSGCQYLLKIQRKEVQPLELLFQCLFLYVWDLKCPALCEVLQDYAHK